MHRLVNEMILALGNKRYCTALFMVIEKAPDKINHESLLRTIRKQLPEQIHELIKTYLSSRTFVIKIKDTYSEVEDIKTGVPQGSVLGPILYTSFRRWYTRSFRIFSLALAMRSYTGSIWIVFGIARAGYS